LNQDAERNRFYPAAFVTQLCANLPEKEEALMATSSERRRAHVVPSVELVREIDALVGRRSRSQFLEEAAAERLQRLRRVAAFERAIATPTEGIPDWESRESAEGWVRELREERRAGVSAVLVSS
jgi:hypothetical protein